MPVGASSTITCPYCLTSNPSGASVCQNCGSTFTREPLASGTRLEAGRFEVISTLGMGGFGIAYLARDRHHAQNVAIKECFPDGMARRDSNGDVVPLGGHETEFEAVRKRFELEAGTLHAIQHPGTTHLIHTWAERGTTYLAMEYLEGRTLEQLIASGTLSSKRARTMIADLLGLLEVVHARNLVHRDIKPANIVITKSAVELIDFGSAMSFKPGERVKLTSRLVTPAYAPLEQFAQEVTLGPPTDLYALAATFYEAVTGVRPPNALDRANGTPLAPVLSLKPKLSRPLAAALEKALSLRVDQRYQTVQDMLSDILTTAEILKRVKAGRWTGATPKVVSNPPPKPKQTQPTQPKQPRKQRKAPARANPRPQRRPRATPTNARSRVGFWLLAFIWLAFPLTIWLWRLFDMNSLAILPGILLALWISYSSASKRQWGLYLVTMTGTLGLLFTDNLGLTPRPDPQAIALPATSATPPTPPIAPPSPVPPPGVTQPSPPVVNDPSTTTAFKSVRTFRFPGSNNAANPIAALRVAPDGSRMAALMDDGTLYLRGLKPGVRDTSLVFDTTQTTNAIPKPILSADPVPHIDFSEDAKTVYVSFPGGAFFVLDGSGRITTRRALMTQLIGLVRSGTGDDLFVLEAGGTYFDTQRRFQNQKPGIRVVNATTFEDRAFWEVDVQGALLKRDANGTVFLIKSNGRVEKLESATPPTPQFRLQGASGNLTIAVTGKTWVRTNQLDRELVVFTIDPRSQDIDRRASAAPNMELPNAEEALDLAASNDGRYVYVVTEAGVRSYRLVSSRGVLQPPLEEAGFYANRQARSLEVGADGRLYVADSRGTVTVLEDLNTTPKVQPKQPNPSPVPPPFRDFRLTRTFDYPTGVGDVQVSSDDRTLVVSTLNDHALRIVPLAAAATQRKITFGKTGSESSFGYTDSPWFTISPDSRTIYATFAGGALYAIDLNGRIVRRTKIDPGLKSLRVSDDSKWVYVSVNQQTDSFYPQNKRQGLLVLDAQTLQPRRFFPMAGDGWVQVTSVRADLIGVVHNRWVDASSTGRDDFLELNPETGRVVRQYRFDARDAPSSTGAIVLNTPQQLVVLSYSGSGAPFVTIRHDLGAGNRASRRWKSSRDKGACGATLSRDGSRIYVARLEYGLEVLDAASGAVRGRYRRFSQQRDRINVFETQRTGNIVWEYSLQPNALCEVAVDSRGRVFVDDMDGDAVLMLEPSK